VTERNMTKHIYTETEHSETGKWPDACRETLGRRERETRSDAYGETLKHCELQTAAARARARRRTHGIRNCPHINRMAFSPSHMWPCSRCHHHHHHHNYLGRALYIHIYIYIYIYILHLSWVKHISKSASLSTTTRGVSL
jgi:hypothetical protein